MNRRYLETNHSEWLIFVKSVLNSFLIREIRVNKNPRSKTRDAKANHSATGIPLSAFFHIREIRSNS